MRKKPQLPEADFEIVFGESVLPADKGTLNYALSVFLHFVQIVSVNGVPSISTVSFCKFGIVWRGALRLLWLTVLPRIFPLPQSSHCLDIFSSPLFHVYPIILAQH